MALVKSKLEPQLDNVDFDDQHPSQGDSRRELLTGLVMSQKCINPKYFYDERGSELFDQITQLPEYYPSRTEAGILTQYSDEIAVFCQRDCVLIEPGSGSSEKVRLILNALKPRAYVPLDISSKFLFRSAVKLGEQYPWLNIHAICADFSHDWTLPNHVPKGRRVVFYPGSTIGNLEPEAAVAFLSRLRRWVDVDGGLLIGVDLHKPEPILHAAYNDGAGITAAFNLNLLNHVNRLLDASFDLDNFSHRAFYNSEKQRIEMHLVSEMQQQVACDGVEINFSSGETIHTESSYKYTLDSFSDLADRAGFVIKKTWIDEKQLFSVHYLEVQS
jgi:L-histidine Nalpha-methyltransferase